MDRYVSVQILRGVSAFMVVAYHSIMLGRDRFEMDWTFGAAGHAAVDVFFVVSGFVMIVAAQQTDPSAWGRFLVKRVMRVYPLYWFYTSIKVILLLAIPAAAVTAKIVPDHLLASYLLVPWYNAHGEIYPLLVVGWTLAYEVFFYSFVVIALALRLPILPAVGTAFVVLSSFGLFRSGSWPAFAVALTSSVLLDFVFGMIVAHLIKADRKMPPMWACIVAALAFSSFFFADTVARNAMDLLPYRAVLFGIPAALLLWAAASLEGQIAAMKPRFLQLLGDASYSTYLSHTLWVSALGTIYIKLGLPHDLWALSLLFAAAILGSTVVGIAAYLMVERPLMTMVAKLLSRRSPPRANVSVHPNAPA